MHVTVTSANTDEMRMEINLIGRTVDEATEELEKYLDRAFLAGLPRVRVIHGHGAGILRRGVREFLKSHPHVAGLPRLRRTRAGRGRRWWSCGSSPLPPVFCANSSYCRG